MQLGHGCLLFFLLLEEKEKKKEQLTLLTLLRSQLGGLRIPRIRLYTDRLALGSDNDNLSTRLDLVPRNLNPGLLRLLGDTQ